MRGGARSHCASLKYVMTYKQITKRYGPLVVQKVFSVSESLKNLKCVFWLSFDLIGDLSVVSGAVSCRTRVVLEDTDFRNSNRNTFTRTPSNIYWVLDDGRRRHTDFGVLQIRCHARTKYNCLNWSRTMLIFEQNSI